MRITRWGGAAILGAALALAAGSPAAAQDEPVTFSADGPVDLSGSEPDGHANIGERVTVGTVELAPGEWTIDASAVLTVEHPDNKHVGFCTLYVRDGRPDAQSDPPNPNEPGRTAGQGGSSSIWDAPDADGHRGATLELVQFPDFTSPIVIQIGEATTAEMVCAVNDNRPAEYAIYATNVAITAVRTPELDPDPTPSADPDPTPEPTEEPAPGKGGGGDELPQTGSPLLVLGGVGGGLGAVGGLTVWLARRRHVTV